MLGRLVNSVSSALDLNAATLSGCIDVVVIPQKDGSLRSTPFHVRFGKTKVLRCSGREVRITVNGKETELKMKLGPAGKAYFEVPDSEEDHKQRLVDEIEAAQEDAAAAERDAAIPKAAGDADERQGEMLVRHMKREQHLMLGDTGTAGVMPRVEFSMCGHLLDGTGDPTDFFVQNRVTYESLNRDPAMWYHPSLVCRFIGGSALYPGKVALPLLASLHAFGKALQPAAVDQLAQFKVTAEPAEGDSALMRWVFGGRKVPLSVARAPAPPDFSKDDTPSESLRHSLRPTAEQLKCLNLKEGPNKISFLVETPLQGPQSVSGTVYLWPANSRIIVSDVDGTITRSDVLGQLLPIMGKDWSHAGVAELFSCCRRNNYRILYLTARAIGQADATRDFLFGLRQTNGAYLPDGPLLMSPDRLFPSFKREVIDRKPFIFKIAALKDVRLLFPREYNPYYAGFGNRDTDHRSYVHVGVPESRVFIIDTKGAVHHINSSFARTYSTMTDMVHFMFPPVPHSGGDSGLRMELADEAEVRQSKRIDPHRVYDASAPFCTRAATVKDEKANELEVSSIADPLLGSGDRGGGGPLAAWADARRPSQELTTVAAGRASSPRF